MNHCSPATLIPRGLRYRIWPLLLALTVGLVTLSFQLVWVRLAIQQLGSSASTVAVMMATADRACLPADAMRTPCGSLGTSSPVSRFRTPCGLDPDSHNSRRGSVICRPGRVSGEFFHGPRDRRPVDLAEVGIRFVRHDSRQCATGTTLPLLVRHGMAIEATPKSFSRTLGWLYGAEVWERPSVALPSASGRFKRSDCETPYIFPPRVLARSACWRLFSAGHRYPLYLVYAGSPHWRSQDRIGGDSIPGHRSSDRQCDAWHGGHLATPLFGPVWIGYAQLCDRGRILSIGHFAGCRVVLFGRASDPRSNPHVRVHGHCHRHRGHDRYRHCVVPVERQSFTVQQPTSDKPPDHGPNLDFHFAVADSDHPDRARVSNRSHDLAQGPGSGSQFHGAIYPAALIGNVAGVLTVGFYLIPAVGLRNSVLVLAGICVFCGVSLLLVFLLRLTKPPRLTFQAVVLLACIGWLLTAWAVSSGRLFRQFWPVGVASQGPDWKLDFYTEGPANTVAVVSHVDDPFIRRMIVDGVTIGESQGGVDEKQQLLAHLPFLLRKDRHGQRSSPLDWGQAFWRESWHRILWLTLSGRWNCPVP